MKHATFEYDIIPDGYFCLKYKSFLWEYFSLKRHSNRKIICSDVILRQVIYVQFSQCLSVSFFFMSSHSLCLSIFVPNAKEQIDITFSYTGLHQDLFKSFAPALIMKLSLYKKCCQNLKKGQTHNNGY